jgi:hypothetical protein
MLFISVGIAMGYGIGGPGIGVGFPAETIDFVFSRSSSPALEPASFPMNTKGLFSVGKATGA